MLLSVNEVDVDVDEDTYVCFTKSYPLTMPVVAVRYPQKNALDILVPSILSTTVS